MPRSRAPPLACARSAPDESPRMRTPRADAVPPRIMVLCCPQLCGPDAGPQAARWFERVITTVTGFCPDVEVAEPGVCAFGARGPARYFGGEAVLAAKIITAVAELGVESRIGVADGMFAARLAARQASPASPALVIPAGGTAGFLAAQLVTVLADQDLAGLLKRLGLGTPGAVAALPAGDVASRFGAAGETAHRLARGLDSRPLAVRRPADDLSVAREFDPPEALPGPGGAWRGVAAPGPRAEQRQEGRAARGLTCVRVQVRATWADGTDNSRRWRHDGLLTAAGVADRVRWQLDGWRAAPGDGQYAQGGIAVLLLVPDQVVRATGHQLALWGEAVISDRAARAAMRVQRSEE